MKLVCYTTFWCIKENTLFSRSAQTRWMEDTDPEWSNKPRMVRIRQ